MEIRLSTRELLALQQVHRDSKTNQHRKDGWGAVVDYPTNHSKVTKATLKALNDAGLLQVCTVHRSAWKGSGGAWTRDTYEVILTEFGYKQLMAVHR